MRMISEWADNRKAVIRNNSILFPVYFASALSIVIFLSIELFTPEVIFSKSIPILIFLILLYVIVPWVVTDKLLKEEDEERAPGHKITPSEILYPIGMAVVVIGIMYTFFYMFPDFL